MYSIPHTAIQASHALPCIINGKAAVTKANGSRKQKVNFQNQGTFIGHGDLISHYICNPSVFKQLGPSTSLNLMECGRSTDLDGISPTDVHQHLGQCIVDSLLQSQNLPFHQHAQRTGKGLPSSSIEPFSFLASSFLPSLPLQPGPQTDVYLFERHKSSFAASVLALH